MEDKAKRGFYKPFTKARIEDDIQDWLVKEKREYKSWNMFFRELKKRYENTTIVNPLNEE